MFGWFTSKNEVHRYNALNEKYAVVYHVVVSNWYENAKIARTSEQDFENRSFMRHLDNVYQMSRDARDNIGVEKALENVTSQIIGMFGSAHHDQGNGESARMLGYKIALNLSRQVIFGIAPGLSTNGQRGTERITLKVFRNVVSKFEGAEEGGFLFGVCQSYRTFIDICEYCTVTADRVARPCVIATTVADH